MASTPATDGSSEPARHQSPTATPATDEVAGPIRRVGPSVGSTSLACIAAGLVIGVSLVLWAFTLAALVFNGALSDNTVRGAGFILAGSIVLTLIMAWRGTHPGTIAAPDEAAGVILGLIATTMATTAPGLGGDALFATVLATVVLSTIASALLFLGLGYFRLGNLVRFIPHPVIGGVVVTMGWLLVVGAMSVMTERTFDLSSLGEFLSVSILVRWLPGAALALVMVLAMRRWQHFLVLPGLFVTAIALFYIVAALTGASVESLRETGWLLGPFESSGFAELPWNALSADISWSLIAGALPDIGSLVLLCVLGLLLSATALEVAASGDLDLNQELKLCGIANAIAAAFGGVTGSHSLEDSLIAREMGAAHRLTGVIAAAACAVALFYGAALMAYLPRTMVGGFILFFGLVLLVEWIVDGWRRMPRADYGIVVLCLLVSLTWGYLEGIAVGILAGIVIFVVDYSRVDVIRGTMSGAQFRSNVERHRDARDALNLDGERIMIMKLQGFIFFGTAHRIYHRIARRHADDSRAALAYVLLDFSAVPGADVSTAASFSKMRQLAERGGFEIVVVSMADDVARQFERSGVLGGTHAAIRRFSDLDRGLEYCEDGLLESLGIHPAGDGVRGTLSAWMPNPDTLTALMPYLEERHVSKGDYLIRQGDPSTDLFFIESGRVAIQLEADDRPAVRLRSMGAGTVVGEVALYIRQPRSASVVAERPSRVLRLTRDALERMKREDAALAAAFNESIVRVLATRLVDTNRMLSAVLN